MNQPITETQEQGHLAAPSGQHESARVAERAGFHIEQRPWGDTAWVHESAPVWIIHYEALDGIRAAFWQGYRSVKPPPVGRKPWAVDNRRVGTDRGFPSLEAAVAACAALTARGGE